ncbi:S-adenosyl-L-methionine-dependent methyltransferase [Piptocephalis cylindrospora]|uniref:S-adenosyl-L-methionine-dependent methyltransferase n=1 Tax=Piptocephalis cylindrospora TaxID=1907219 RepID=A0A4P9Y573_9FUNG|nr:S-adenosyl-L-methionine-dependent methyltransferase [Piptocephalis cylindrospora]|eukprot:RKP14158.1 S-adenosyl-L-methionine-dependent methyltransferase [Piptocephalis cylindrospora]
MGGALVISPDPGPLEYILIVGMNSGVRLQELVKAYPHAHFLGVDVDLEQIRTAIQPNCRFHQMNDFTQPFPAKTGSVDLVTQHFMYLQIGLHAWRPLIQEYFRVLKPGGCIDMVEVDAVIIRGGDAVGKLNRLFERSIRAHGVPHRATRRIRPLLDDVGFVDTEVRIVSIPVGHWAGRMGISGMRLSFHHFSQFKESIFKSNPGLTLEELEDTLALAVVESNEHHAYRNVFVYTARKPFEEES